MVSKGSLVAIAMLCFFLCLTSSLAAYSVSGSGPAPAPAPASAPTQTASSSTVESSGSEDDASVAQIDDGRCGPNHGGKKCTGKECCSKSGWCGGEKGTNSNWCVNINKGWWSGAYDGEEEAPAVVISDSGGYNIHKDKFLPTAEGTDVDWWTGEIRPSFGKKVTKVRFCKNKCDELDACKGFTYKHHLLESQRKCWLKTDKVQTTTLTDSDTYDTYIKDE